MTYLSHSDLHHLDKLMAVAKDCVQADRIDLIFCQTTDQNNSSNDLFYSESYWIERSLPQSIESEGEGVDLPHHGIQWVAWEYDWTGDQGTLLTAEHPEAQRDRDYWSTHASVCLWCYPLSCFETASTAPEKLVRGILIASGTLGSPLQDRLAQTDSSQLFILATQQIGLYLSTLQLQKALENQVKHRTEALDRSEQNFRSLFFNAAVGIAKLNLEGNFLLVNDRLCQILGYSPSELYELTCLKILHPNDQGLTVTNFNKLISGEVTSYQMEKRYFCKNGSVVWVNVVVSLSSLNTSDTLYHSDPLYNSDPLNTLESKCLIAIFEDISDRKASENYEDFLQRLGEEALNLELSNSEALYEFFAYTVESLVQVMRVEYAQILELFPEEQLFRFRAGFGWQFALTDSVEVENSSTSQAGYTLLQNEPVTVSDFATECRFVAPPFFQDHGIQSGLSVTIYNGFQMAYGVLGVHSRTPRSFTSTECTFLRSVANLLGTVLQRYQAQQILQTSEAEHRSLLTSLPSFVLRINRAGIITFINRCAEGVSPQDIVGTHINDFTPPEYQDLQTKSLEQVFATGESSDLSIQELKYNGSLRSYMVRLSPIWSTEAPHQSRECLESVAMIASDVTEQVQATAALKQSEDRYATLAQLAPVGIFRTNREGEWIFVNDRGCQLIGLSGQNALGQGWSRAIHADDRVRVLGEWQSALQQQSTFYSEYRFATSQGKVSWVIARATPEYEAPGKITGYVGTVTDITDRKAAEIQLAKFLQELEMFKLALDQTAIVAMTDARGVITYVNQKFIELSGYSSAELVGQTHRRINSRYHPRSFFQDLWQTIRSGEVWRGEIRNRAKDGLLYWVDTTIVPFLDHQSQPYQYLSIRFDITRTKRSQAKLQETMNQLSVSENQLRLLIKHSPVAVAMMDRQMRYLQVSDRWIQDYNLQITHLEGKSHYDIFPEIPDRWKTIHQRCLQQGVSESCQEDLFLRQNGEEQWLRWELQPWFDAQHEVGGLVIFTEVINDRLQARRALEQLNAELEQRVEARTQQVQQQNAFRQQILESMSEGLCVCELEGYSVSRVSVWNPRMVEITGYTQEEVNEKGIRECLFPDQANQDAIKERIVHDRLILQEQWEIVRADGQKRWIEISASFLSENADINQKILAVIQDITDRRAASLQLQESEQLLQNLNQDLEQRIEKRTQELLQAKEAAELANRAKSTFLANMSHELRTPLNVILGYAQILERNPDFSPLQREQLSTIASSGSHLLNLISDILDVSKIEAGQIQLEVSVFNLQQLTHILVKIFQVQAQQKGLFFKIELDPNLPEMVETDERKLRQILINLLSNAFKFTDRGSVTLTIALDNTQSLSSQQSIYFSVQDTGIGISLEEIEKIYDPFFQIIGAPGTEDTVQGTGLGLCICKHFIDLLGGTLNCKSTPQQGSQFFFTLPVNRAVSESETSIAAVSESLSSPLIPTMAKVLVAEDDRLTQTFMLHLLNHYEFEVKLAKDGRETLEIWQDWQPDLIFLDIRMPELNGLEVTQQIRQAVQTTAGTDAPLKSPVIVAITASAFAGDRDTLLAAGCDEFLTKPLKITDLERILNCNLKIAGHSPASDLSTLMSPPPGKLSAEDLACLPLSLCQALANETRAANHNRLLTLLNSIPPEQETIALRLRELINKFDFPYLLDLLESRLSNA